MLTPIHQRFPRRHQHTSLHSVRFPISLPIQRKQSSPRSVPSSCVSSQQGERWSLGTWSAGSIQRQLLSAVAVAVQRGNALTMLAGFTRTTSARAAREQHAAMLGMGESGISGGEE